MIFFAVRFGTKEFALLKPIFSTKLTESHWKIGAMLTASLKKIMQFEMRHGM